MVVVSAESTYDKAEAAAQLARDDELRQQSNCRTEAAEQLLDEDDWAWHDSDDEDDATKRCRDAGGAAQDGFQRDG